MNFHVARQTCWLRYSLAERTKGSKWPREINKVVDFWELQAAPEYDATFLEAPPVEEDPRGTPQNRP